MDTKNKQSYQENPYSACLNVQSKAFNITSTGHFPQEHDICYMLSSPQSTTIALNTVWHANV